MLRTALATARLPLRSKLPFRSPTLQDRVCRLTDPLCNRTFSTSPTWRAPNSLDTFTEEEQLLRDSGIQLATALLRRNSAEGCTVKRFAQDVVEPKVREMDENEAMDPSIIKGLFDQGVRDFTLARQI